MKYRILIIVALFAVGYWLFLAAPRFNAEAVTFTIAPGQSTRQIATHLKEEDLIKSTFAFSVFARLKDLDTRLQPGGYSLSSEMNLMELLGALDARNAQTVSLTIPEGFSVYEIDERLAELGLMKEGEFTSRAAPFEGYLFPDTYFVFNKGFSVEDLIQKMQENFNQKIDEEIKKKIAASGKSLGEIITMASILEKEVRARQDLAVVSGILWKRLAALPEAWPLQADATLLYGKKSRQITQGDLEADSPYNTRIKKGLPPTPIGNPGLATIQAALAPQSSAYWFYLTDTDGAVHYAVTNDEQNRNKEKYLNR